ncbi:hypothetical protein FKP32DRAFT_1077820 [Trametes sanguinea]|nr:hypothetical protein FKP32DRAFT_1077820 [Trametes sanguinea]
MASDDGYVYVDDADPRIVVSDNWGVSSISYAYDGTLHGASVADATATFTFTGTAVSVVGGIGAVSEYGWPSSSYAIDGKVVGTFDLVTDGHMDDYNAFSYNYTYFTSPVLSPGKHTLVVTTLNGTSPNTYWLDYIRFLPPGTTATSSSSTAPASQASLASSSYSSTSAAGSVSTSPTFTSNTSGSTSLSFSASSSSSSSLSGASSLSSGQSSSQSSGTSGTPALPPSAPAATNSQSSDVVAGASSHSSHVGAIIGGAVGGAVLLALLAILGVYLYLRRRAHIPYSGGDRG